MSSTSQKIVDPHLKGYFKILGSFVHHFYCFLLLTVWLALLEGTNYGSKNKKFAYNLLFQPKYVPLNSLRIPSDTICIDEFHLEFSNCNKLIYLCDTTTQKRRRSKLSAYVLNCFSYIHNIFFLLFCCFNFKREEKYGMEKNLNFNYCIQYQFLSMTEETMKRKEDEDKNGKEIRMKGGQGWRKKNCCKIEFNFFCPLKWKW